MAVRGLENAALIGFAGDYTQPSYIQKISEFLKRHQVRIVNLSIGLPKDNKNELGLRDVIKTMRDMIQANPETLFVVAAGNEEKNLDENQNRQYPASFNFPNVLKVGALDATSFEGLTTENAKMADYSNTGKESVDILAPGKDLMAASLGGGLIAHTGTSMASPVAANAIARLWIQFPHLTAAEVRSLVIATAHPLAVPVDIGSRGFLDIEAAKTKVTEYPYAAPSESRGRRPRR